MRVVAVLQARMGSTRLPGKVAKEINGLPLVVHIWRRLLACRQVDGVIVSVGIVKHVTEESPLVDACKKYTMRYHCWPQEDLLMRLLCAGQATQADTILRVRADCLFIDPNLMDTLVEAYRDNYPKFRGLSNWPNRHYSEGLDAEVMGMELLSELSAAKDCPREDFATWAIAKGLIKTDASGYDDSSPQMPHLSIDTQADLDRATKMIEILGNDRWDYMDTLNAYGATR